MTLTRPEALVPRPRIKNGGKRNAIRSGCRSALFSFFFAALFFFTACVPSFPAEENAAVYVSASGEKYHRSGCFALRRSKISLSLEEALASGYEPCAICRPPAGDISSSSLYRVHRAGLKNSREADILLMSEALVTEHVDGDTVRVRVSKPEGALKREETIRLLGVDAPETVRPHEPVQRFGREASAFTQNALLGRPVYLALDWDLRDKYGRLLAYVYTEEGQCFNAELIRQGYASAYLRYPFQFMDEFKALEREAKRAKRGLWASR